MPSYGHWGTTGFLKPLISHPDLYQAAISYKAMFSILTAVDVGADEHMAEPQPPGDLVDDVDLEFSFHSPKALGQWGEETEEMLADLKRPQ